MNAIAAWLLVAVTAWGASPIPAEELARSAEVRRTVAEDIAAVAYDRWEPPYYAGPYGRATTALTLTSLAAFESRFLERIITGHCRSHECDSGKAVGMLQVHPGDHGLRFLGAKAEQCHRDSAECWSIADLAGDETMQIRAGLHILRTQGFRAFTRSSDARTQAAEWMAKHPPPMTDAAAMGEGRAEVQK